MMLLTRRQGRAAMAAAAGAATYWAVSELGARRIRLGGLFVIATVAMAGTITSAHTRKLNATANRLDTLMNSGGTINGDLSVTTLHVNGTQLRMLRGSHGTPPGGGPASYSPLYCSNTSQCEADIISACQAAGIFS